MQKMLEPEGFVEFPSVANGTPVWIQGWADGLSTYLAAATGEKLFFLASSGYGDIWVDASRVEGYNTDGYWDSFAWGDTCVFNNGIDPPQVFNSNTQKFEDLPSWGMISTADDILNNAPPSRKVQASCVRLVPYKSFLVAVGVTEGGLYQPNKVWWSDSTNLAGYYGAPNWDYETPASLSGQIVVDPEGGAIRTGAVLNEQLIIYTDSGATAMQLVGGRLVMNFRRLFKRGAAGLHCVTEVQNQHFVVSQDTIYIHDGSTVVGNLIAKDRVEEEFYKRIGKGGRFGDGSVDWNSLQVVKDPDRKEVIISYTDPSQGSGSGQQPTCVPATIVQQPVDANAGGGTVTFMVTVSGTEPITYQWYEDTLLMSGETNASLTVADTSTSSYYVAVSNPCGSAQSNTVGVVGECVPVVITSQPADYVLSAQVCRAYSCPAYHDAIPTISSLKHWFPMGGSGSDADPTLPDVVTGDLLSFAPLVPNEYLSFHAPLIDTCDGTYGFQKLSPGGGSITDVNSLSWMPRITTGSTWSVTVSPNGPNQGVAEVEYLTLVWADETVTGRFQNLQVSLLYQHLVEDQQLWLDLTWSEEDSFGSDPILNEVEVATGIYLPYLESHNITVVVDTTSLITCDVTVYKDFAEAFSSSVAMASNSGGVRDDLTGTSIVMNIESTYQDFLIFETPLGGVDLATLRDGFERSQKGYTDPVINCTPPIVYCETYACDAYSTALDAAVDSHWLLQEGVTATNTELDTNGVMPLTVTHTGAKGPTLLADQCSPSTGSSEINWSNAGGRLSTDVTNPVPAGIRKIGGVGFFAGVIPSEDQEGRVMDVRWGGADFVLTVQSTGPGVYLNARGGGPSHIFTGNAVDGKYIWANYYIYKVDTETDDWSLDVEVFVDWVSVGSVTLNHTYVTPDIDMDRLLIGEGGTGRWNVEHAAFASKRLGADTIAGLADSLAQNNPAYVDPTPDCVPV
jgi:hypothetical protein